MRDLMFRLGNWLVAQSKVNGVSASQAMIDQVVAINNVLKSQNHALQQAQKRLDKKVNELIVRVDKMQHASQVQK